MKRLCEKSLRFLEAVYREDDAMFPYSTRVESGRYVSDYDGPGAMRYTINTLLGLARAREAFPNDPFASRISEIVERFLERNLAGVDRPSDMGLLLALVAEWSDQGPARGLLRQIREAVEDARDADLVMQDLGWMLWGACAATREGLADAEEIAHALFKRIRTSYLCQDSLMPRHSLARHRGGLVSFGAVTYYLRAVAEYASTFDDEFALQLFKNGVERVLALQGRQGEWPWMIGVANARCLDFYPVYSVHQDAMAMLFLFPAMEAGVEGCALAVRRSLDWLGGVNQLGRPMLRDDPFLIYRCVQRRGPWLKLRRYAGATWNMFTGGHSGPAPNGTVEINRECRSYHLGWLLYAWAGRNDFAFTAEEPAAGRAIHTREG